MKNFVKQTVLYVFALISLALFFSSQAFAQTAPVGTWTQLGPVGSDAGAVAVSPNFASDQTIFANTNTGVYKSIDAGTSWVQLTNGLPEDPIRFNAYLASLAISPQYATDKTVFVSDNSASAVYKSTDGGASWQLINHWGTFGGAEIALSPQYGTDQTMFIAAGGGDTPYLAKSTDGGATWQTFNPYPAETGRFIKDFAFSPNYVTDQTIFAATDASDVGGVLKSTDGGATWSLSTFPVVGRSSNAWAVAVSPSFAVDHTVYVGTEATDGIHNFLKSVDGGMTWLPASTGIPVTDVQDIVISSDGSKVFASTGGDGVFVSADGASSWQLISDFSSPIYCGSFMTLALSSSQTLYGACSHESGGIWKYEVPTPMIFGGFAQPINSNNSSVFKLGRSVVVKFNLTDENGSPISDAAPHIYIAKVSDTVIGTEHEALSTNKPDNGNVFRYDSASGQYIFNLDTRNLSSGTWQLRVQLDNGTSHTVLISLQ